MFRQSNSIIWVCINPKCPCKNVKTKDKNGKSYKKTGARKPASVKKLNKQLDESWSLLVKLLANHKCEYCGTTRGLQSHHLYTRKNYSVRWDTDNGICLCAKHHTLNSRFSAHGTPLIFTEWITNKKGQAFMDKLRIKVNRESHYSLSEKELILEALNKEINKLKL